ncbi:hypothetical protein Mzhil_1790 [Methanosalsum zhilinae DSM 4017]|uniref:Uncharacterized protein n=1 Tax=Methanosalsum zhilinae (strain DSM 4017 / NBRC 107636 / OCM 62 / WeN5) TaxID=679901 RepID=F7XQM6_METZD|nr:hypothetical protein [Methanosalsum zhilinae]AEH61625.1 hypothetical protein Mzhil_1790 [Methanosalsum zhilinae DSM 4017]
MKVLPTVTRSESDENSNNRSRRGCGSGGCSGEIFGITAGAEKDEVIRTITIYLVSGVVMILVAYIISKLLTALAG